MKSSLILTQILLAATCQVALLAKAFPPASSHANGRRSSGDGRSESFAHRGYSGFVSHHNLSAIGK